MALDYFSLDNRLARIRTHFSNRARRSMYQLFLEQTSPTEHSRILDIGVTPDESLPESNFFEKLYPHKHNITASSIEDAREAIQNISPDVRFIQTTPHEPLPFRDDEFDIVFSSAVLEHAGDRRQQEEFIREALRVGKKLFLTTPNRWHPVEFHTMLPLLHWLPQGIHQRILRALGFDFLARTENLNLLDSRAITGMLPEHLDYRITHIRFLGFRSNIILVATR